MGRAVLTGATCCALRMSWILLLPASGCVPMLDLAGPERPPWTPTQSWKRDVGVFASSGDRTVQIDPGSLEWREVARSSPLLQQDRVTRVAGRPAAKGIPGSLRLGRIGFAYSDRGSVVYWWIEGKTLAIRGVLRYPRFHFNEIGSEDILTGDARTLVKVNLLSGSRREWPVPYTRHTYHDPASDSLLQFEAGGVRVNGRRIEIRLWPSGDLERILLTVLDSILSLPIAVVMVPIGTIMILTGNGIFPIRISPWRF